LTKISKRIIAALLLVLFAFSLVLILSQNSWLFSGIPTNSKSASQTTVLMSDDCSPVLCASSISQMRTFYADSLFWEFSANSTGQVCQTSSDGIIWSAATDIVNAPDINSENSTFSIYYNPSTNTLYYVATFSGANKFQVRWGTLSSSGCGSINWSITQMNETSLYAWPTLPTITQDSYGDVWVSLGSHSGTTEYNEIWRCSRPITSCTWTLNHTFTKANSSTQFFGILNNLGSGHISDSLGCTGDAPTCAPAKVNVSTWNGSAWNSLHTVTGDPVYADSGNIISVGNTLYGVFPIAGSLGYKADFWSCSFPCSTSNDSILLNNAYAEALTASSSTNITSATLWLTVWAQNKTTLWIQNSTDGGSTWSSPTTLVNGIHWAHGNSLNIFPYLQNDSIGMMWESGSTKVQPFRLYYTVYRPFSNLSTSTVATLISTSIGDSSPTT
jgi:hypothetical protein